MLTLVEKITILCEINNTNIARVEKAIGISNGSIKKWVNSVPSGDTLLKLAQHFHVKPESLLDQSESIELEDEKLDGNAKVAELTNLLELLNLSEAASAVAKDMLISIKKNVDNRA